MSKTEPHDQSDSKPDQPPRKRGIAGIFSSWMRFSSFLVAVALVLICFAPALISRSSLSGWLVQSTVGSLLDENTIRAERLQLGWNSSQSASQVALHTADDSPVLEIEHVETDRSLLRLLLDSTDLGKVTARGACLSTWFDQGRFNVESVLTDFLDDVPSGSSADPMQLDLDITDGRLTIDDRETSQRWVINLPTFSVDMSGKQRREPVIRFQGVVQEVPQGTLMPKIVTHGVFQTGMLTPATSQPLTPELPKHNFQGEMRLEADPATGILSVGRLALDLDQFPAELANLFLRRFELPQRLAGRVTGKVDIDIDLTAPCELVAVSGHVESNYFKFSTPELLANELRFEPLSLTGKVRWSGDRLLLDSLDVKTSYCETRLDCELDFTDPNWMKSLWRSMFNPLTGQGYLDLAPVAAMLPDAMRISENTTIRSGRLIWDVSGQPGQVVGSRDARSAAWQGSVDLMDIEAVRNGQLIRWQEPIRFRFDVNLSRDGPDLFVVKNFQCSSDFLNLQAAGDSHRLSTSLNFDLNRLSSQLSQLIDLGETELSGTCHQTSYWILQPDGTFQLNSDTELENLVVKLSNGPTWRQPRMTAACSVAGTTDLKSRFIVTDSTLQMRTPQEWFIVRLLEPTDLSEGSIARLAASVETQGDLAAWHARLGQWNDLNGWNWGGALQGKAQLRRTPERWELSDLQASVQKLVIAGPTVDIKEPLVKIDSPLVIFERAGGILRSKEMTVQSTTLSARSTDLIVERRANEPVPRISGYWRISAALDSLWRWFQPLWSTELATTAGNATDTASDPAEGSEAADRFKQWAIAGEMDARVQLGSSPGTTTFEIDATVEGLKAQYGATMPIDEQQFRLISGGAWLPASGVLRLSQCDVQSGTVNASLSGDVSGLASSASAMPGANVSSNIQPASIPTADLRGTVQCDWANLSKYIDPYTERQVRINGRLDSPVRYQGPIVWSDWGPLQQASGELTLTWDSANCYGLLLGPTRSRLVLADAQLRIESEDRLGGVLQQVPTIRHDPQHGWVATFDQGPLVSRLQLNPQMCANALKYAAPAMAGVTTAEGNISVDLTECLIPIEHPKDSVIAGNLLVHDVRVGTGPLVRELGPLLDLPETVQLARNSVIAFRMVDRRIHHSNQVLVFGETLVQTSGSVGLDQTMKVTVAMPLPKQWLGSDELVNAALANKTVRVPMSGTLKKPQLDRRALDEISRQFMQDSVQGLIEHGLDQLIPNLFNQ